MNDSRHFDPFSRPMGRPDCRPVPKRRRWPLRVLLALAAVLAVAAVSAASVYGMLWLSQRLLQCSHISLMQWDTWMIPPCLVQSVTESLRLDKASKIKSNCPPTTTIAH